jgi:hypothetical protein
MQSRLALLWCHAREISSNSCAMIAESMSHSQASNVDAACAWWLAGMGTSCAAGVLETPVDGLWVSSTASCVLSCSGNFKSRGNTFETASCDGVGSTAALTALDIFLCLFRAKCAASSSVQYGLVVPNHVRRFQMSVTALLVIPYLCARREASRSRVLRVCCLATKMMMASAGEMVQTPAALPPRRVSRGTSEFFVGST